MSDAQRLTFATGALPPGYNVVFTARRVAGIGPLVANRVRFIGLNRVRISRACRVPLHRHAVHELVLVEAGPYRCAINGTPVEVRAGDMIVVKPGDTHEVELRRGQRHWVLHFVLASVRGGTGLFDADSSAEEQVIDGGDGRVAAAIHRLVEDVSRPDANTAALQDVLMEEIYWRMLRAMSPRARAAGMAALSGDEDFRRQVAAIFEDALGRRIDVGTMAGKLGMSRRALTAKCRRVFGQGPAHAFMDWKLQRAALLLAESPSLVKSVSYELGFQNPYHFSRAFRTRFGVAPSAMRKKDAGR